MRYERGACPPGAERGGVVNFCLINLWVVHLPVQAHSFHQESDVQKPFSLTLGERRIQKKSLKKSCSSFEF